MSWPEVKNAVDWILAASIAMFFLGVTRGFWELSIEPEQQDDAYIIGGLLMIVWCGLRFFPPPPRNGSERTRKPD